MSHQADIFRQAKKEGKDPAKLTTEEYHRLRLKVRTLSEIIVDGVKREVAITKEIYGWGQVPEEIKLKNLNGCRANTCGSYGRLADGTEVCHNCNCTGRDLETKAAQDNEYCPHNPPVWDNRTLLTIKATDVKPD